MKINAISSVNSSVNHKQIQSNKAYGRSLGMNNFPNIEDLKCMPIYYPIQFSGGDMSKVRKLFAYGIPDMYSERILIDPKTISKWLRSGFFSRPAKEIIQVFDNSYSGCFIDYEADALNIIRQRSNFHPNYTMREILQEVRPVYSRILRKEQTPVFHKLWEEFENLPDNYKDSFHELMQKTDKMLNDKPIIIPFSSYEFKYKLAKIKTYLENNGTNQKAVRVMSKLIKESLKFSNTTNADNIEYQKSVFQFLNHIRKRSILKNHEPLSEIFSEAKLRLDKKEITVPFGRKSFIYDLMKIIEDLPDEQKNNIHRIANTLPTSSENFAAYMLKISTSTNDQIGYKYTWPSMATIEHLHPRSMGGTNDMENLGIASAIENSKRKNIDFTEQLELVPKTPEYTQRTINRLLELNDEGIFDKINLSPRYITGYANTVYEESAHKVKLDTGKLAA